MKERASTPKLPDHPAFTPPAQRHPVANFFGWAAAFLVIVAASYNVYAWQHKTVVDAKAQATALQSEISSIQKQTIDLKKAHEAAAVKTVSLVNGAVSLTLPDDWMKTTAPELKDKCLPPPDSAAVCEDVNDVTPAVYNSNASHFKVAVKVFKNPQNVNAKTWFEKTYKGSLPRPEKGDQLSMQPIHGYDAYYFLQNVAGSYKDLYYVVVGQGHSVVLYSRVYAVNSGDKGVIDDFTSYLPVIRSFVETMQIKA